MKTNFCLLSDCYKQTHHLQYPQGTKKIYSYLESRGGMFDKTLFFGLQMILKKYFVGPVVEQWMIDEAETFCQKVFGANYFNRKGWQKIVDVYGGHLPIAIRAVREGTVVPTKNVLVTVENLDPELAFLTNYVETVLLQVWYPITVATLSYHIKELITESAKRTGGDVSPFHLNDFGFRGVSSVESAGIGGAAHLVNFLGTDTIKGIEYAMKYYNSDVCGHSVMATEHSTTTVYGKENEFAAYQKFFDACPTGILSVVADSYDIFEACEAFGTRFKDIILARDGKFVVRPDSGNPSEISVKVLDILWKHFGGTTNKAGFKVLNPKVGMIYGDGINYESIKSIIFSVELAGYSIDNIVFGMGGALLQQVNRDTQKFAFKCSAAKVDGQWRDVFKDPITDQGKSSKRGRLKLVHNQGVYSTVDANARGEDCLVDVFATGFLLTDHNFKHIRERAAKK